MASQKKVIVRQFDGSLSRGYLPLTGFLVNLTIQLLDLSGRVQSISLDEVKSIAFVKEFHAADDQDPERLGRRSFSVRPRTPGILVGVEFRDRDKLEGISPPDLSILDSLIDDRCLSIVPPDAKSNAYRLLIPRSALAAIEFGGMATPAKKRRHPATENNLQNELFGQQSV